MVDIIAAEKELQEINFYINWIDQELEKTDDPEKAKELRARLYIEQKKLNTFDNRYGIREYL